VALYTAEEAHCLLAADDHIERLDSWVGNTPAVRIGGVSAPTRVASVAALGGHPALVFGAGGVLLASGLATLLQGAAGAAFEVAIDTTDLNNQYLLDFDGYNLSIALAAGVDLRIFVGGISNYVTFSTGGTFNGLLVFNGAATGYDRIEFWQNGVQQTRSGQSGAIPATIPGALVGGRVGNVFTYTGGVRGNLGHLSFASAVPSDSAAQSTALHARYS